MQPYIRGRRGCAQYLYKLSWHDHGGIILACRVVGLCSGNKWVGLAGGGRGGERQMPRSCGVYGIWVRQSSVSVYTYTAAWEMPGVNNWRMPHHFKAVLLTTIAVWYGGSETTNFSQVKYTSDVLDSTWMESVFVTTLMAVLFYIDIEGCYNFYIISKFV